MDTGHPAGADPAGARYSLGAIVLHWAIAALIVLNFLLVWTSEDAPKPEHEALIANHKAVGLVILALSVLRLAWRAVHPSPPFAETLRAWEAALAKVVHSLFYLLLLAIPLTGWAMVSLGNGGEPVDIFGLFTVPGLPFAADRRQAGTVHEVHELFATLTLVLLALHVAAAIKHQFIDRDTTLARMVPWLK